MGCIGSKMHWHSFFNSKLVVRLKSSASDFMILWQISVELGWDLGSEIFFLNLLEPEG